MPSKHDLFAHKTQESQAIEDFYTQVQSAIGDSLQVYKASLINQNILTFSEIIGHNLFMDSTIKLLQLKVLFFKIFKTFKAHILFL